jgi:hypothetical protein
LQIALVESVEIDDASPAYDETTVLTVIFGQRSPSGTWKPRLLDGGIKRRAESFFHCANGGRVGQPSALHGPRYRTTALFGEEGCSIS